MVMAVLLILRGCIGSAGEIFNLFCGGFYGESFEARQYAGRA